MEEQYPNDGFRKHKSRLAMVCSIIAVAALGLQIAGVVTNHWVTVTYSFPRVEDSANAGLWKACHCFTFISRLCGCEGVVKGKLAWYKAFAVLTIFGMLVIMVYEFVDILWERTSARNAVRYTSRTLTFLCTSIMLAVFGANKDGYYSSASDTITRLGYSFVLCVVAAALTGVNVLIGMGEICMKEPPQGGVISNPGARDTAPVMQQDVLALEHNISVQQQHPYYYYVDMQRDGPDASAF